MSEHIQICPLNNTQRGNSTTITHAKLEGQLSNIKLNEWKQRAHKQYDGVCMLDGQPAAKHSTQLIMRGKL